MNFYLKTKEECDEIVNRNEAFIKIDRFVEDCNVVVYDYRLASLSDFVNDEAFELRGLCFVEQPDGTWKRNILMNKFFNVDQTDGWLFDDVKDKKITRVQNKEDGSICSFVKFPNGKIRAKSKTSFISDQAQLAQSVFDAKPILQEEVSKLLDEGKTPIFELVSPENQIVLEYQTTELILLQIRNEDGSYVNGETLKWYSNAMCVKEAKQFNLDGILEDGKEIIGTNSILETLLYYKKIDQSDIEGWVVTFSDGQMAKIKTQKYLSLHGLIGPDAFRENLLVQTILDGNIDDVISALVPGEKKDKIVKMDEKVTHNFNHLVAEFITLRGEFFNKYREDRKSFSLDKKSNPLFGAVMKTLNTSFRDVEKTAEIAVKDYILKRCKSLTKAKEFIDSL